MQLSGAFIIYHGMVLTQVRVSRGVESSLYRDRCPATLLWSVRAAGQGSSWADAVALIFERGVAHLLKHKLRLACWAT